MAEWLASNQVTFPDGREELEPLTAEGEFVGWRSKGVVHNEAPLGPSRPHMGAWKSRSSGFIASRQARSPRLGRRGTTLRY